MKKYATVAEKQEIKNIKYADMIYGVQKKASEEAFKRPAYCVRQTHSA